MLPSEIFSSEIFSIWNFTKWLKLWKGVFHMYPILWTWKTITSFLKSAWSWNFLQSLSYVRASCWPNFKSIAFTSLRLRIVKWKTPFHKSVSIWNFRNVSIGYFRNAVPAFGSVSEISECRKHFWTLEIKKSIWNFMKCDVFTVNSIQVEIVKGREMMSQFPEKHLKKRKETILNCGTTRVSL